MAGLVACNAVARTAVLAPMRTRRGELVVDLLHKALYAFTTGFIGDALATDPPAWMEARR